MHAILMYFSHLVWLLGQKLGSESVLPYLSPRLRGEKLLAGANFASAGIGILNDTGAQFVSLRATTMYIIRSNVKYG